MYTYFTYGLGIQSTLSLPELIPSTLDVPDISIQLGKVEQEAPQTDEEGSYFHLSDDESFLFWETAGKFLVREGKEIVVDPAPGVPEKIIRLPLLGTVLAAAIQQRGFLGLHASAVDIGGRAVAFVGYRGRGKSTMAAALVARGHKLIADDLVVLDALGTEDIPLVRPGFPQLKLFPEAAAASFGDDPSKLPALIAGFEKRARHVPGTFSTRPVPLNAIFFLETGPSIAVERMPVQEAVLNFIRHSYTIRVFRDCLDRPGEFSNLRQCAALADRVSTCRLVRPRDLNSLAAVAEIVENTIVNC
jgi:hypothetical protein